MTNNQSYSLLLPPQNNKARIAPGAAGKWQAQTSLVFAEVADSLELPTSGNEQQTVSSFPDMWARPLLVEMVLRDEYHPLHSQIKAEWKGMLAAIALAKIQGLNLKAKFLQLDNNQYATDSFVRGLNELIPDPKHSVYHLDQGKNPWTHLYIFLLQGKAVGMTSPATLICPAEGADWKTIPWKTNDQLQSPIHPTDCLTLDEKTQLWYWLQDLLDELNKHTGDGGKIREIVKEFQGELAAATFLESTFPQEIPRPRSDEQYFGVPLLGGALKALDRPIALQPMPSQVSIMPRIQGLESPVLFIPDRERLIQQWRFQDPKDIWIYDSSLLAFNQDEFFRKYEGEYLTEADLFLETFHFIKKANKLPGAQLPTGAKNLIYDVEGKKEDLTPLLPINSKLLNYFTPEELNEILELQPIVMGSQSGVRVSITLPLSGGQYKVEKDYVIAEANAIEDIPFLELWPNFKTSPEFSQWREYYAFYYDDRLDKKNQTSFQILFPKGVNEVHPPELVDFQITRLEEFPSFLICQTGNQAEMIGIILLKTPPKIGLEDPQKTWRVGVDFGTSFTHVYYKPNRRGVSKPLTWSPLLLQVTDTPEASRRDALYNYFISPKQQNFPLATVLTTQGNKGTTKPIFDGRIHIPEDIIKFDPQKEHIETNLKWQSDDIPYKELFLKHLALVIAAEAAQNHVRKIEWTISYPTAFSPRYKSIYRAKWNQILQNLEVQTGMNHQWLAKEKGRSYRSESITLAHYFESEENQPLAYTTCIDLGGGTADISIWRGEKIIHQCSIELGGRLLFSQFVKRKPEFLQENFSLDISQQEAQSESKSAARFYAKLDAVLLAEGQKWLETERALLEDSPDLEEIIQGAAIGIAGLYYYVGIVLRGLDLEEKSDRQEITPVLIGGNGSRLLHWLDAGGQFSNYSEVNRLLSRMMSQGSGFNDTRQDTRLSEKPKAEVACGLVADQNETRLRGLDVDDESEVFAGEVCQVNGEPIDTYERIRLPDNIYKFEVINLSTLQTFLDDFHQALKKLKITTIKPLNEYKYDNIESRDRLWRKIRDKVEIDVQRIQGNRDDISSGEPPFILGLKWLLYFLARRDEWEQQEKDNIF
ncbi:MAG: hypothetical protein AAGA60_26445 [Cyanobacteria bacterium P01_E01_bin.42]